MGKNEYISLYDWKGTQCFCALCGERLVVRKEGYGRDAHLQPYPCTCAEAKKASEHNKELLTETKALRTRSSNTPTPTKTSAVRRNFSLAEVLSVVSGCVICRVEPVLTEDRIGEAIGGTGSAKEKLLKRLPEKADALCTAAAELVAYIKEEHPKWDDDISAKLSSLAEKHQLSLEFTL